MSALALNDYNELERFLRLFTADVGVIQYVATLRMDILHVRLSKLLTGLQHLSRFSIVPRTLVGVVRGCVFVAYAHFSGTDGGGVVNGFVASDDHGTRTVSSRVPCPSPPSLRQTTSYGFTSSVVLSVPTFGRCMNAFRWLLCD